jgi:hypothetical protein
MNNFNSICNFYFNVMQWLFMKNKLIITINPRNILKIYSQLIGIQLDLNPHLVKILKYLGGLNLEH